jgi:hypothetical protein
VQRISPGLLSGLLSALASASLGTYLYNTWLSKPAAVEQFEKMNESLLDMKSDLREIKSSAYAMEAWAENLTISVEYVRRAIDGVEVAVNLGVCLIADCY